MDHDHDPDLFWALRGSGGSFGVVTALELELHPVAEAYAGILVWPVEHGAEVLECYRVWTASLPEDLTSAFRYLNLPPIPAIPEPMRGRPAGGVTAEVPIDPPTVGRTRSQSGLSR